MALDLKVEKLETDLFFFFSVLNFQVEGRCEKYYHQMEEVVSSFEMIAGLGAAKCYTALIFTFPFMSLYPFYIFPFL